MNDLPDVIEQLVKRVESLEHRVAELEHLPAAPAKPAIPTVPAAPGLATVQPAAEASASLEASTAFSVLGRAMLGIAGAYLLRAAAQTNLVSNSLAAAVAIPYAIGWLAWAARTRAGAWFAAAAYAGTSALILAPMLWELTFRFHVLSAPGAAAVLAVYVGIASALAWKRNLAPVFWVANIAAVLIAISLSIASHVSVPFIAVLLFMLALCEFAEARGREAGARALTSLAADLAIWATIYIYVSPPASRTEYPNLGMVSLIAPGFALLGIFLASVVFGTVVKRQRISVFEVVQTIIAFLLAVCGLIFFGPPSASVSLGVLCLILAVAGYVTVYLFFRGAEVRRNYRVFSTWSAALFIIGCLTALPTSLQVIALALAAVAATALGARFGRLTLEVHGTAYLLTAAAISGLAAFILHVLADGLPGALFGASSWGVYFVFLCAVFCYVVMPRRDNPSWSQQALHLLVAFLAICGAAALLVRGLMGLIALHVEPQPHHLALFRTFAICAAAVALAYGGSHWRRIELTRLGYAALVLVAIKLVTEDLRHGRLAYIAASIFIFAVTLIAVPRVARRSRNSSDSPDTSGPDPSGPASSPDL